MFPSFLRINVVAPDADAVNMSPTPLLFTASAANDVCPVIEVAAIVPEIPLISSVERGAPLNPIPILFAPVGDRRILPVDDPPSASVCAFVVPSVPAPVKNNAPFSEPAEIDAVGTPERTFINA